MSDFVFGINIGICLGLIGGIVFMLYYNKLYLIPKLEKEVKK